MKKPLSVAQVRGKARLEKLASGVNPSSAMYFIRTRRTPAIEDIDPIFSLYFVNSCIALILNPIMPFYTPCP